jgi:predicted flavoprotein YhiN
MQEKIYDIAIIGGWASGIFTSLHLPKNLSKIILEKTDKIGSKVLLSWGERCNISNMYIEDEEDYVGENKKILLSLFHKFSQYDMLDWLKEKGIQTHIEDNGRILLSSGKSEEIINLFKKEMSKNEVELKTNFPIENIEKEEDYFTIYSWDASIKLEISQKQEVWGRNFFVKWAYLWVSDWAKKFSDEKVQSFSEISRENKIFAKKVIIATGGKSFAQIGTDGWGYTLAKKFDISLVEPYKWLCGITTKQDLSHLSGTSVILDFFIYAEGKLIYSTKGSLLFTHFWISWPVVFNGVLKIWEYLRKKWITSEETNYIKENIEIKLLFSPENITKKINDFFVFEGEEKEATLHINDFRSWKEAKVTGGGIKLNELNKNFESKKVFWLYFIGEVLDITGKSGGFNLQLAWSEAYTLAKSFSE